MGCPGPPSFPPTCSKQKVVTAPVIKADSAAARSACFEHQCRIVYASPFEGQKAAKQLTRVWFAVQHFPMVRPDFDSDSEADPDDPDMPVLIDFLPQPPAKQQQEAMYEMEEEDDPVYILAYMAAVITAMASELRDCTGRPKEAVLVARTLRQAVQEYHDYRDQSRPPQASPQGWQFWGAAKGPPGIA